MEAMLATAASDSSDGLAATSNDLRDLIVKSRFGSITKTGDIPTPPTEGYLTFVYDSSHHRTFEVTSDGRVCLYPYDLSLKKLIADSREKGRMQALFNALVHQAACANERFTNKENYSWDDETLILSQYCGMEDGKREAVRILSSQ